MKDTLKDLLPMCAIFQEITKSSKLISFHTVHSLLHVRCKSNCLASRLVKKDRSGFLLRVHLDSTNKIKDEAETRGLYAAR